MKKLKMIRLRKVITICLTFVIMLSMVPTIASASTAPTDTLLAGQILRAGQSLVSSNGVFIAIMQADGNFVVYDRSNSALWNPLFSTVTGGNSGAYFAFQGTDRNMVVYDQGNRPIWNAATHGTGAARLVMQNDGHLVAFNTSNPSQWIPVWSTHTIVRISASLTAPGFGSHQSGYAQRPTQTVTITNTGTVPVTLKALPSVPNWTLVQGANWTTPLAANQTRTFTIRPNNGLAVGTYNPTITITSSSTIASIQIRPTFTVTPAPPSTDILNLGQVLRAGQALISNNGRFRAIMQADGNFVVYDTINSALWTPLFNTLTGGNSGAYLAFQGDQNLVIYDQSNRPIWNGATYGTGASRLVMQNDGTLVAYTSNNIAVWFFARVPSFDAWVKTTGASLALHTGPGAHFSIFTTLNNGAQVRVQGQSGTSGDWWQVGDLWVNRFQMTDTNPNMTLTFNGNGGTPATQTLTRVFGATMGTMPTIPTRTGFTFAGWFTAQSGGTELTSGSTVPNANTTYWARWTNQPSVSVFWPMPTRHGRGNISSPFGWRNFNGGGNHWGVDIDANTNERVNTMAAGTVATSTSNSSYGNYVIVRHDNGYTSLYAHLNRRDVSAGQNVTAEQQIGGAGDTGNSFGVHLHFEVRTPAPANTQINPLEFWHPDDSRTKRNEPNTNPVFLLQNNRFVFNPNFIRW